MTDINFEDREAGDALADVRALIPDFELLPEPSNPDVEPSYLFSDSVLGRYLRLAGGTMADTEMKPWTATTPQVKRAVADAYMALATSEMLILKKITSQDRSTDGSVLANQYRQMAKQLRDEADALEAEDEPGAFVLPYRKRPAAFDGEVAARRNWGFPW